MTNKINNKLILSWFFSALMAGLLFFVVIKPVFAEIIVTDELSTYVINNDVEVGEETVNGYRQVYYIFNDEKVFVSNFKMKNSRHPKVNKEYMVWITEVNGAGQIFLYHIPTDTTTALTNSSTNLDPEVDDMGRVVWRRWIDEKWQIFFFDGVSIKQLTEGDVSVDPDIDNGLIVFSRQDKDKNWRSFRFNISNKQVDLLLSGQESRKVEIKDGEIVFPVKIIKEKRRKEKEEKERKEREMEELLLLEEEISEETETEVESSDETPTEVGEGRRRTRRNNRRFWHHY
jgi:hypothetical protein